MRQSEARAALWEALDAFEDELAEQEGRLFLGRGPSAWTDTGVRHQAEQVAAQEGRETDEVIGALLAEAYGEEYRQRWIGERGQRVRRDGAPPRRSPALDRRSAKTRNAAIKDARRGRIERAQARMHTLENAKARDDVTAAIACAHGRAGNLEDMLDTVGTMRAAAARSEMFAAIAGEHAKEGALGAARAAAARIEVAGERGRALKDIAQAQAQGGDHRGALATAREIKGHWRDTALMIVAEAQAEAGEIGGAQALTAEIARTNPREAVWKAIARAQAQAGDHEGARASAQHIVEAEPLRVWALEEIEKIEGERE